MERLSKHNRILDIYIRLCEGKIISKTEEAMRFGVNERSIQRDIDEIRAFFDDKAVMGKENRSVAYSREKHGFIITGEDGSMLDNSEILAVSKILLASRAFTKDELSLILRKIVVGCVPQKNLKLVSDLIANEQYHYVQLTDKSNIKQKLWSLGEKIRDRELLTITYRKQGNTDAEAVKRVIEPIALIFSEYYFYLNAYIIDQDENGRYVHKHDYPAVFRIDRIDNYRILGEKFHIQYADRFEEGEFRKRVQFMYPGKLMRLRFNYMGKSVQAILDRLPTARIAETFDGGYLIEAEVFGKGILMWLLSQGDSVEVVAPQELRREMAMTINRMAERYARDEK